MTTPPASKAGMQPAEVPLYRVLQGLSLIVGPTLAAAATFVWDDGRYGVTGGALVTISAVAGLLGIIGLWDLVRARMPLLGSFGVPLAILGAFGGIAFGLQGFFEAAFGLSKQESMDALAAYPTESAILLWWLAGPALPLSTVALGVALVWNRLAPRWAGSLLAIAGVVFPLSRIPRIDIIAHAADLLMLIPLAYLGWQVLRKARPAPLPPA